MRAAESGYVMTQPPTDTLLSVIREIVGGAHLREPGVGFDRIPDMASPDIETQLWT